MGEMPCFNSVVLRPSLAVALGPNHLGLNQKRWVEDRLPVEGYTRRR